MKIGIFGHSNARYKGISGNVRKVCLLVQDHFPNYQINWYGVADSSQDRAVKLVQKHKSLDLYIIFHSFAQYVYCPFHTKDFHIHELKKAALDDDFFIEFKKKSDLHIGDIPDLQQIIKSYITWWLPDQKDLELRFRANLILLKMVLKNKNVVHVAPHYPAIKTLLNYGRYSKTLSHLCYVNGTDEQFASAFAEEIKFFEIYF
jgi:hypothetical protein